MWLILIIFALALFYYFIQSKFNYWAEKGVPGPKPAFLVGNFGKSLIGKISFGDLVTKFYNDYQGHPFVGVYRATSPLLIVRDPEFIKLMVIKDFKHFQNNDFEVDKEVDPIFGRNPFVLKGAEWKLKRSQLTQCFTSGKIKGMYAILEKNSKRMVKYIEDECKNSTPLESRELCVRLTLDNVAACVFGLEGKCFDEPYSDFRELADQFLSPDSINKLKSLLTFTFPFINNYIKIKLTSKQVEERLFEIVRKTLQYRKENNIVVNDFLDSCTQLSTKEGLFTDVDIVAHAASFFVDGYETSSRTMSFMVYELAANPDVQEKLRQELNESYEKNGNKFTYDSIQEMQYLDACLNESLRKHTVVHFLNKVCTEDYTYTSRNPDMKNMTIKLKTGDSIAIPLMGLQNDPKYFDQPEKYMPERFLHKDDINRFTFMPFGEGQRICLGQRFAITQMKVGIAHLFKNFRCTVNQKTQRPFRYDPFFFMLHVIGGMWLNFEKIE